MFSRIRTIPKTRLSKHLACFSLPSSCFTSHQYRLTEKVPSLTSKQLSDLGKITVDRLGSMTSECFPLNEEQLYKISEISGNLYSKHFKLKLYQVVKATDELPLSRVEYPLVYIQEMRLTTDPPYYAERYCDKSNSLYFREVFITDSAILKPCSYISKTIILSGMNPIFR